MSGWMIAHMGFVAGALACAFVFPGKLMMRRLMLKNVFLSVRQVNPLPYNGLFLFSAIALLAVSAVYTIFGDGFYHFISACYLFCAFSHLYGFYLSTRSYITQNGIVFHLAQRKSSRKWTDVRDCSVNESHHTVRMTFFFMDTLSTGNERTSRYDVIFPKKYQSVVNRVLENKTGSRFLTPYSLLESEKQVNSGK
jgi:hypothetical protein